jgi:hypothetical protein
MYTTGKQYIRESFNTYILLYAELECLTWHVYVAYMVAALEANPKHTSAILAG